MACAQVDVDLKCKNIFQKLLYPFVTSNLYFGSFKSKHGEIERIVTDKYVFTHQVLSSGLQPASDDTDWS